MARTRTQAPPHPGETLLEEFLRPAGITQKAFADGTGISAVRVNQIVRAKRGVTPDTALRFARVLGTSPEFWLNLQVGWDLHRARRAPAAAGIRRLRPLRPLRPPPRKRPA